MDLVETTSYLLALSPLFAIVAVAFTMLWTSLMKEPLVQMAVNATLVVLETTEIVWKPVLSGILGVTLPIGMLAVALLKPLVKGLLRIVSVLGPHILSLARTLRSVGIDLGFALKQMVTTLIEFASSLAIVMKAIGKGIYYAMTGLSTVITSVDRSLTVAKQLVFSPSSVTWDDLTTALLPFGVTLLIVLITIWRTRPARPSGKTSGPKAPRRSDRIARKRAMLLSGDLTPLLSPCQKAPAASPNL